jgi:DNA-binding NarL/FixJ family response regulator
MRLQLIESNIFCLKRKIPVDSFICPRANAFSMGAERAVENPMLRILLIEDEGRVCVELAELLSALPGVEVTGCVNSEGAAIDELMTDRHRWDLAVVDLALSIGSGLRVLSAGRVRRSHQRMIVLNDRPTHEMRRRCVYFGADAVFDKASDVEALLEYCRAASRAAGRLTLTPNCFLRFFTNPRKPGLFSLFKMRPETQELAVRPMVSRSTPSPAS